MFYMGFRVYNTFIIFYDVSYRGAFVGAEEDFSSNIFWGLFEKKSSNFNRRAAKGWFHIN